MSQESLTQSLPSTARLWIYQADRALTADEQEHLTKQAETFVNGWNAHGAAMKSAVFVRDARFLIVVADEEVMKASGCSIDSSVRFVKEMGALFSIDFFERTRVNYQSVTGIESIAMADVATAVQAGKMSADTLVYDLTIASYGELESKFLRPLKDTWLSRFLSR